MQIFINGFEGKTFTLKVEPYNTIFHVKEKVKDNPNIYKQDLIILDKNSKYKYLELQVDTKWINKKFGIITHHL